MDKYYIRNPKNEATSGVPLNTKYPHVNRNATSNFILTCKNKNVKSLKEEDNSKIYYHGSNAKFTQFDKSKIRPNKLGLAFNFTDDYSMAYQYGDNIIKAHLDLNNPITEEVLSSPWTYEQDEMLAKIMGFPRRSREDWENTNETFGDVYNVFKQYPKFIKVLQNLGYDGLAFPEDHHYGVFEPEQIHIIDDLKYMVKVGNEIMNERYEQLEDGIYATQSAYDVLNQFKNKPKPYRIVYDKNNRMYFIGDAFNIIHQDMLEAAFRSGFYPQFYDEGEIRDYIDDCMFNGGELLFFAYYPDESKKQDVEKSSDGYSRKYTYDFGVIYCHEMTPLEDFDFYQLLGAPIKKETIYEDIIKIKGNKMSENLLNKLNKVMKPINNQYWTEIIEDMGGMGAAPCPALGQSGTASGCTVNGVAVAGQSVKEYNKKKKKSKKHEAVQQIMKVTPEEMLEMVEECNFSTEDILETIVTNNRETIRVSVFYSNPQDPCLVHGLKREYLDEAGDVIDTIYDEDLTIRDVLFDLKEIFNTHEPQEEILFKDEEIDENVVDSHIESIVSNLLEDIETQETEDEIKSLIVKANSEENEAISSYLQKAKRAEELGLPVLAKLFKELADDETVHTGCLQGALSNLGLYDMDAVLDGEEEANEIMESLEEPLKPLASFKEKYEEITNQIAKQLDKMNFEFANTEDIIYKKEGEYKYLFKFDNELGTIKIKVLKGEEVLFEKEWALKEEDDVSPIFTEIENIYGEYGL